MAVWAKGLGDKIVIGFGYDPGGPGEEFSATSDAIRKVGERVTTFPSGRCSWCLRPNNLGRDVRLRNAS